VEACPDGDVLVSIPKRISREEVECGGIIQKLARKTQGSSPALSSNLRRKLA
jgi:hypothetical protein